jgi:hypothetical protein
VRSLPARSAPGRRHQWTPLGQRLVQRYSVRIETAPGLLPKPMPLNQRPADEPIVREILLPYGTRDSADEPDPRAVFMLASALVRSGPDQVTSRDPVYPVTFDFGSRAEAAVCAALETLGRLASEQLVALVGADPGEVLTALRRMLAAGIVVQSATDRPPDSSTEEDEESCGFLASQAATTPPPP